MKILVQNATEQGAPLNDTHLRISFPHCSSSCFSSRNSRSISKNEANQAFE